MKNLKFLLGALLVLGLVACGEKKEEEKPAEQPAATTEAAATAEAPKEEAPAEPQKTNEEILLTEIRDLLKNK